MKGRKITINCEDREVEGALVTFLDNYKGQVEQFIEMFLRREGKETDPALIIYKTESDEATTEINLLRVNISKGDVIVSNKDTGAFIKYSELDLDTKYLEEGENGQWNVFLKTDESIADAKLGHFKSLKEGLENIDSDQVEDAINRRQAILDAEKADKVEEAEVIEEKE